MNFKGEQGEWRCYTEIRETPPQFVFYSLCPVKAPTEKRQLIAEFLTRANYDLLIGNFEFDFEDGEIRYKTSIDVEGSSLDSALIQRFAYKWSTSFTPLNPPLERGETGNQVPSPF